MKPTDEVVKIEEADYQALIERVRSNCLEERDRHWIVTILQTFRFIQAALEQKKVAVFKLRELLFGKRTEKDKKKPKAKRAQESDPSPKTNDAEKESLAQSLVAEAAIHLKKMFLAFEFGGKI